MSAKVVLIGVGNPLLGDEGLGIAAIDRLREQDLPESVGLVDGGTNSLDALIDAREAERVIIVDAVDGGAEPGTLFRLDGEQLLASEGVPLLSLHQLNLKESLCLAELAGFNRDSLVVLGMQPAVMKPSMCLSDIVEKRMDTFLSEIKKEIRRVSDDTYGQETD